MGELVSMFQLAWDASQVRNATLAGSVVPVVIGLVLFRIVAGAFARVFIIVIALVAGGLMYLQRQEITDCVSEARAGLEQLDAIEAPSVDCKLFGFDLSLRP